ncbi:hypothetical protein [Staphylococcus phage VB-SauS-SA2]|nr:hypothetical protein [Staphylococcus phage VB-SauS-SA2]
MQAILGVIVGIIFLLAYLPQLKSLHRNKTIDGVSTFFWMLIALSTAVTASNLWEAHAVWYVFTPQYINSTIALIILLWVSFKKHGGYGLWIVLMTYSFLIGIFSGQVENTVIQHWASIFVMVAYLEQIIHMVIKKTSEGINYLLYVGFATGLIIMVFNIITTGAPVSAAITECVNIVMMIIAIIVTLILNKKKK